MSRAKHEERHYYTTKEHINLKYFLIGLASGVLGVFLYIDLMYLRIYFNYATLAGAISAGAFLILGFLALYGAFIDTRIEKNYLDYDYD